MPGRVFVTTSPNAIAAAFGAEAASLPDPGPRLDIAPGESVLAVLAAPRRIAGMRWGLIPMGRTNARGRPVLETIVNARGETLFAKSAFEGVGRCIVPVSGWYEWTGAARRKTRWRIAGKAGDLLAFAAVWDVWRAPGGSEIASLATVTCPPNSDLRDIHHRMPVILDPSDWPLWLDETPGDPAVLIRPSGDGLLDIAAVEAP